MIAKRKYSTYKIFFLSYVLILLIAISSLFVYYAKIAQQVAIETQQSKLTLLNQLEGNLNSKVQYADILANSVASDNKLSQIAKGYNSYTYKNLMSDMRSAYKPDYLLNFSVYIASTNEIITEGIHMKAPEFFEYMYRTVDISYEDFAAKHLNGYKLRTLMPPVLIQSYGQSPTTVIPYIQSFPLNPNEQTQGQILILINAKDVSELIQELNFSTRSYVYVLDQNNQLILSSEQAPDPTQRFIRELHEKGEIFQTEMNKVPLMITQINGSNKWKYIMATPKSVYFQDNAKFALTCVIIFLVYLAVGLLVVRFLAKRSYRPIKEINDIIQDYHVSDEDTEGKNEFHTIKNTLISQFHTDKQLKDVIQKQMPIVRQAYLLSLIKGLEPNYDEMQSKLPLIGVTLVSQNFLIVALEFDLDSPFFLESDQFVEESLSLARVVVQNVGSELMEENQQCYFLDLDRNQSVFLLNIKKQRTPQEEVNQVKGQLNTLIDFTSDNFKLNINLGISAVHSSIKNLPKCFDEAKKALESSKKKQTGEPVCFGDEDIGLNYYFSMETEYQLVSQLKSGNYHESRELLNNVFEINGDLNATNHAALLHDIAAALVRVMNGVLNTKKKPPVTDESLLAELGPAKSPDEARLFFLDYIDRIADESENRIIRKTELLVNNIVEFINKNIEGSLLDLNYISSQFGVTPQYISNIFKKYKHENIKDYISKLKIQRTKELLITTNLSLNDISVRLGYVNELGVFRLFRKYEDMTPGEYRAINRKLP